MPPKIRKSKKVEPPKSLAKCLSVLVSVGSEDKDRDIEEFVEAVKDALRTGKVRAKNVTVVTPYYIIDGKVCLPQDFDPKTKNFLPGKTSPPWAGGPAPERVKPITTSEAPRRSPAEALKDLRENTSWGRTREIAEAKKAKDNDEGLEEFDWDISDLDDEEKLGKHADASARAAIKKMKGDKPKKVIKRKIQPEPPKKKVVVKRKGLKK